jgi:hypothetical protein
MELLGDVGHVKSHFGPFGDSVSVRARKVHGLSKRPYAQKSVWTHPMVLLGVEAEVDARFGLFGDNANLTQD